MLVIEYPPPQFGMREEGGKSFIFDALRKKWLLLTPEEWVRQNFVSYLVRIQLYPAAVIAQEKMMSLGDLKKRFDILVYDRNHKPWMMVECKSPTVPLNDKVLQQLLRYNLSIPVDYLVITNGAATFAWHKTGGQLEQLTRLPGWTL